MKLRAKIFFLTITLCFISVNSFAWNALGHMVVANIAYENLKPQAKQKVDALVATLHKEYPEITSFAQLAAWPDSIRGQHIDSFTHWHYIDTPIGATPANVDRFIDTDNVVWALGKIPPVLQNPKANPYEQARFLAFFAHLTGDIHQPLHTVTRVSAEHPDGDRGGNLYLLGDKVMIDAELRPLSLHHLWDTGCGAFNGEQSTNKLEKMTQYIIGQFPAASFDNDLQTLQPSVWANEGILNANKSVYTTPENHAPTRIYLEAGKKIAQQQAALAGYRLASILNTYFDV